MFLKKDRTLNSYNKKLLELKANNNKIKTQIQNVNRFSFSQYPVVMIN